MHSSLHHQHRHRDPPTEFLHHARNHHGPQPHRIPRYKQKRDLPRQPQSRKSVIKSRMRDGRRIVPPDHTEQEVQRRNHQHSPYPLHPKHHLREFHSTLLLHHRDGSIADSPSVSFTFSPFFRLQSFIPQAPWKLILGVNHALHCCTALHLPAHPFPAGTPSPQPSS